MDVQHLSAPSRASSGVPRAAARSGSGVVHANTPHTRRYTVVGNHLTQHRELTLVAIGLAAHIQSLPAGARIGIKCLADRFPEGEARIAAALRELEAHGYLERTRERLPNGRIITHTVSYNQPEQSRPAGDPVPRPKRPAPPALRPRQAAPPSAPVDVRPLPAEEDSAPAAEAAPAPQPRRVAPPLPRPRTEDPVRGRAAAALLADLRRDDPRLLLAERDVHRLAPAVAAWLERGAAPDAVRAALAANLPEQPRHPAALLAHRLPTLLPPPLPPAPKVVRPDPFQTCEDCDRAFRAPSPGRCRDCRPALTGAA
ncbi:helix-turn-helix domain-containing protein [Streptomyces sp. NPDC054887]